jgi:hypothetical protein
MIKQPSVYRNPPDPGFVGGYNWSAMFVGLLLLVLVNIGATQFVAYRLEYQPALGTSTSLSTSFDVPTFRLGTLAA